jgi:hypothetical protein
MEFSRCARAGAREKAALMLVGAEPSGLSKLNSVNDPEVVSRST